MADKALVTVYILIYKDMKRIPDLLKSIVNQTYNNIELLISDDGSPNISYEDLETAIEPYKFRFKNIIINKNEKNKGTVQHLNGIIPKMNGDILCGIAADDLFYDFDVISSVVDFFKKNQDIDIVTSRRFDEGDKVEQPIKKVQKIIKDDFQSYQKIMFRATPLISGAGTFFRKGFWDKYGYYPEEFKLVEDASLFTKLIAQGIKIGFLDKVTILHGAGGVSDKNVSPHPWYTKDMDYLYSTWLYYFIPKKDIFSRRCVTYHKKRRKIKKKRDIILLYILYIDICLYLFWLYKENIVWNFCRKIKGVNCEKRIK